MVASDRISAFDVVLPTAIPGKGAVLTQMSRWWFGQTAEHRAQSPAGRPGCRGDRPAGLAGAWASLDAGGAGRADRRRVRGARVTWPAAAGRSTGGRGTLAGERLPRGLLESRGCPQPRFTPAVKNDVGHDENISRAQLARPDRL